MLNDGFGRKYKLSLVACTMALGLNVSPAVAQDDLPPLKMRATNSYPQDMPIGRALDFFAKRAGDLSGGKITVQVFHAGKLYTEDKSVQAVLDGTAEMSMASASNHGPFTKVWELVEVPFLLDPENFRKLVIRGELGKELKKKTEKDRFKPLMVFESGGHRVVGGAKLIKVPADIKDLKIRVAQSPVIVSFYRAVGANPTVVPWGETYLALANHTVDGLDAILSSWPAGKLWEVTKHISTIHWAPSSTLSSVSVAWWNKRTPKQQAILLQAAKETEEFSIKEEQANVKTLRDMVTKNGVAIYDPTPQERALWREAGKSMWKAMPDVSLADIERVSKMIEAAK